MKLSDRMQVIADHVTPDAAVADIGTDHGQIPVWLFARGIVPKAILADISPESLAKAKETAGAYQFGEGLSFRVGDGLSVLEPGEADTVIIAGMGGKLIRQILDADISLTRSFPRFILQPRKGAGPLRKWLLEQGFRFVAEDVVRESHFLPEIITVERPEEKEHMADRMADQMAQHTDRVDGKVMDLAEPFRGQLIGLDEEDIRLRVPPWTTLAGGPLEDYFDLRIGQEQLKLDNMRRAKNRNLEAEKIQEENLSYLRELRNRTYDKEKQG